MSRTSYLAWAAAALFGATASIAAARPPDRAAKPPNFVVFLTDDLGWGDLGCYGHPRIQTPNIDRFARQGMRFTQCYSASSVCSPSRSAILTRSHSSTPIRRPRRQR